MIKPFEFADENQKNLYKKFPSTHYLSNPNNVDHVLLWSTLFRRNLHLLARDYLGIKLHMYQAIILYFMGVSQLIAIIASRAAAKTLRPSVRFRSGASRAHAGSQGQDSDSMRSAATAPSRSRASAARWPW